MQAEAAMQQAKQSKAEHRKEYRKLRAAVLLDVLSTMQFARLVVTCAPHVPDVAELMDVLAESGGIISTDQDVQ